MHNRSIAFEYILARFQLPFGSNSDYDNNIIIQRACMTLCVMAARCLHHCYNDMKLGPGIYIFVVKIFHQYPTATEFNFAIETIIISHAGKLQTLMEHVEVLVLHLHPQPP